MNENNNSEVMPMTYADLLDKLITENKQLTKENEVLKAALKEQKKEPTETPNK